MASRPPQPRAGQLWQFPLLLVSLGLFAYAGYLLIKPPPGPSIAQRLEAARKYLAEERARAATGELNALLTTEKLTPAQEGATRMLLGEALEMGQRLNRVSLRVNHERIIWQTKNAMTLGIKADAAAHRRLAESYDALGRVSEAIHHYRQALSLDSAHALKWKRKIIELQLPHDPPEVVVASLDDFLKSPGLTDGERAWALGEKAHVLVDRGDFQDARDLLTQAMKLHGNEGKPEEPADTSELGQFNYWLGYCAWKLGNAREAEAYLRLSRDQLRVQHPLDADAAYLLGRLREEQHDYTEANAYYVSVLQNHLDSHVALPAKLGRGICRIALKSEEAGLTDLHDVVRTVQEKEVIPPRLKEETLAALQQAGELLSNSGNVQGALELMAHEQTLEPKPPAKFFERLGKMYERRAAQLDAALADAKPADRPDRQAKIRDLRAKAGDAFIAYSRALTLSDDKGYGLALWQGIGLYDQAGDLPRIISALETFVGERPDDPHTPDALLRLGHAYHAAGLFDKAIAAYKHCQFRYAKSLAATRSGVPLARACIAKGPEFYKKAEEALRGVIEDNVQITPEAQEFAEALVELAQLYYKTERYELAINRLEEVTQRYPADARMGQLLFLMADSYRKSADLLDERIRSASSMAANQPAVDMNEAVKARADRLARAKDLYQRVIAHYRAAQAPGNDLDKLYMKLSHFYRADCVYDAGDYLEAIKLYDDAAFRYQEDPSALAAYVQIVNANVALGRVEEAKAANERAKWMLRRMPGQVFDVASFAMSRKAWEQWLKWSGESGLWK